MEKPTERFCLLFIKLLRCCMKKRAQTFTGQKRKTERNKNSFLFFAFIMFLLPALHSKLYAQAPERISYQAVIRNSSNGLISNQSMGMRISILQGSVNGNAIYVETQTVTSNANGLVSAEIGAGNVVSGSFQNINWGSGPYFIKTETDPAGGNNYSISSTEQLLSVPYALYAKTAASVPGALQHSHYIGEAFGGGVIFHLFFDDTGTEHGLIVATEDQSNAQSYSNVSTTAIGASASSSWNGEANSNAIVAQAGHTNSAAKVCLDLVLNGYNDWYLPSLDELRLLWRSRYLVNRQLSNMSGAFPLPTQGEYWSSTEYGGFSGLFVNYFTGVTNSNLKSTAYRVRAIRAF